MRLAHALPWLVVLLLQAGCSGKKCVDHDGDGRGPGCAAGPDCDDHDPSLGKNCNAAARKCAADPFVEGCPCLANTARRCYAGAEVTQDMGACRAGLQTCAGGEWTACEGEVVPHYERCNGEDDDCDGIVDEGVLSPCGGCNSDCVGGVWGPPVTPFEAADEIAVTPTGELTLALHPIEARTVWVPNTGEGTLSKVDAESAVEVARYRVEGETPERVAVDHDGDAWVLSPSLDGQSMLTKVAGIELTCVDRGGSGLRTSHGPSDLLPLGEDDCVLLRTPVGGSSDLARALAVDGTAAPDAALGGHVWIGLQTAQRVIEIDGESGALLREVPTPGLSPFDAVFDPWGALWVIDRNGLLARIDLATDLPTVQIHEAPLACYALDALASDAQGTLTLTGFSCEDVLLYEPSRDLWKQVKTTGLLDTRGVTVLGDQSWVTSTAGRISRVLRDPLAIEDTYALDGDGVSPIESIAVGADSLGQLWVVSSMGGPHGNGVLTRFDPMAHSVSAQVPLGRLPRGQGDITGNRRLGEFAPEASAQHVFDGCSIQRLDPGAQSLSQPTDWQRLHVAWDAGVGSSVVVEGRRAASPDQLAAAQWTLLGTLPKDQPPFDVPFETGGVVEVRLTLRTAGRLGAPRVARVGLEWRCPGPS